MRIGIFSDCHRETDPLIQALKEDPVDLLIGLGDYVSDGQDVAEALDLPLLQVRGNGDWASRERDYRVLEMEGFRLYLCHGHHEKVKGDLMTLAYTAQDHGADLALFGHTHQACDEVWGGVRLVNPGSAGAPNYGQSATYLVMDIKDGDLALHLKKLD